MLVLAAPSEAPVRVSEVPPALGLGLLPWRLPRSESRATLPASSRSRGAAGWLQTRLALAAEENLADAWDSILDAPGLPRALFQAWSLN